MSRSLDFTACNLPCKNPCWRRLTKEEIEWLEKTPNRQAYTLVCIEKQANDVADNKIQTTCDICGKEIIGIENFINAGDKVVCSEECKQKAYFNDYVEHCEIGMDVDDITEINKMTELNKQWCEGTLEKDKYYYAKDSSEGDCIVHMNESNEMTFTGWEVPYEPDQSNVLEPFKLRTELLAQVPDYVEWKQLKEYERIVTSYNMKPIDYEIACETVNKLLDEIELLEKQLKIAIKALKNIIKEDMYNLDEHRVFIEETLKQIKELENAK